MSVFYFPIPTEEFVPHHSAAVAVFMPHVSAVHMLPQEFKRGLRSLRRLLETLATQHTHTHTNAVKAPEGGSFLCCLLTVLSNPLQYLYC